MNGASGDRMSFGLFMKDSVDGFSGFTGRPFRGAVIFQAAIPAIRHRNILSRPDSRYSWGYSPVA